MQVNRLRVRQLDLDCGAGACCQMYVKIPVKPPLNPTPLCLLMTL